MYLQITALVLSHADEQTLSWASRVIERSLRSFDALVLPVTQDVLKIAITHGMASDGAERVVSRIVDMYSGHVVQVRAWLRIIRPLIELVLKLAKTRPDILVIPSITVESLVASQHYTIDMLRALISRSRRRTEILRELSENVRRSFETGLAELENILIYIASRGCSRTAILCSSCFTCLMMRKLVENIPGLRASMDILALCTRLVPPTYLLHIVLLAEEQDAQLLEHLLEFVRKYVLDYVVLSNATYEAFCSFLRDVETYSTFCEKLLRKYCPLRRGQAS